MKEILPYRDKALTVTDFNKILIQTEKYFVLKPRLVGKRIPKYDNDGTIYGWEHDLVPDGYDFHRIEDAPQQLIDAIMRPVTVNAIREHLFTLSRMKRYTGGDSGLYIIAAEIHRHLPECSEVALMKVCDDFSLDTSSPFFPLPAAIIANVKSLQARLEAGLQPPPLYTPEKKLQREQHKRTFKDKRNVRRMCKLALKHKSLWTKWERRFFERMSVKDQK